MALRHSMVARALELGNERSRSFFVERYGSLHEEALATLQLARAAGGAIPLEGAAALVIATLDGLSTQWLLDPDVDIRQSIVLLEGLLAPAAR